MKTELQLKLHLHPHILDKIFLFKYVTLSCLENERGKEEEEEKEKLLLDCSDMNKVQIAYQLWKAKFDLIIDNLLLSIRVNVDTNLASQHPYRSQCMHTAVEFQSNRSFLDLYIKGTWVI